MQVLLRNISGWVKKINILDDMPGVLGHERSDGVVNFICLLEVL